MKKSLTAIAAALVATAAIGTAQAEDVLIGSCIYKFDDTFMTGVRNNMQKAAESVGAEIELVDSQTVSQCRTTKLIPSSPRALML